MHKHNQTFHDLLSWIIRDCAMAVVESDQWGVALRRYNNKIDSTPFRELVSRMPGLCLS